jgi:hypothetical protein
VIDVALHKKVLNLKGVHLLLVFYHFERKNILLLGQQAHRKPLFENAHFGHDYSDLPINLVNVEKLLKKLVEELALDAFTVFGLKILILNLFNGVVFLESNLLTKCTFTSLIVELVNNPLIFTTFF